MTSDAFEKGYRNTQVKAILGKKGYGKDTPAHFALKALIEEREDGGSLLNSEYLPIFALPYGVELPAKFRLAQNPLKSVYPDVVQEPFLVGDLCTDLFAPDNFYLLRKGSEINFEGENIRGSFSRIPRYFQEELGTDEPLLLEVASIPRYYDVGLLNFKKMLGKPELLLTDACEAKETDPIFAFNETTGDITCKKELTRTIALSELSVWPALVYIHRISPALSRKIGRDVEGKEGWAQALNTSEGLAKRAYQEVTGAERLSNNPGVQAAQKA
ncbi:MAG: hypothetical protein JW727_05575 [Candidatus Aenigmarchaeota archaeon]|nr:hypothetical protein [Candidatus Aenigmarchaeota archaeon]